MALHLLEFELLVHPILVIISYCPVSYFVPLYSPPLLFPPHTCCLSSRQSSPTLSSTWFPAVAAHNFPFLFHSVPPYLNSLHFHFHHTTQSFLIHIHTHHRTLSHFPTPHKSPTNNTYSTGIQVPVKKSIDRFHVTSLPPCWRTITKYSSLASVVSSSNMAATSLSYDSLGIDCKPSINVKFI